MSDLVIIDTDVLIDAGRGIREAVGCLEQIEQQASLAVSAISQMELIVGCRSKTELRTVERFLQRFHILPTNEGVCEIAVELLRRYRLSHNLLIADALIAATALSVQARFVTKNQKDYRFVEGLLLLGYPRPFTAG